MRWSREGDEALVSHDEDVIVDYMERKSVELADLVVSPSQYLLQWMRADGWNLPQHSYVANNILQPLDRHPARRALGDPSIRELVFFRTPGSPQGRSLFLRRTRLLAQSGQFSVTFLGSDVTIDRRASVDYVRIRAAAWTSPP